MEFLREAGWPVEEGWPLAGLRAGGSGGIALMGVLSGHSRLGATQTAEFGKL